MLRYFAIVLLGLLGFLFWRIPSAPHSRAEIEALAYQLFEFGAVNFFTQEDDGAIFKAVEAGEALSDVASCRYRQAYTIRVEDKASLFDVLDANIHFADDFGVPTHSNNCGENGIPGRHDLHDISALNNIRDIRDNLANLSNASSFQKVFYANDIQKDLEDLMVHLTPAVHALGVHDSSFAPDDMPAKLQVPYLAMIDGFKTAQFSNVNSCDYWRAIDKAVVAYSDLVYQAQNMVADELTKQEFRLAGRWLAPQTIAARLDVSAPMRPRPNC